MRYLTSEDFYLCSEEARRNGAFFIPFGLVVSDDPTDNFLNLPLLGNIGFDVQSIELMNYDTFLPASVQPTIILNKGTFTDGAAMYSYILGQVHGVDIRIKCFYFRIQLGTGQYIYTEVFNMINERNCRNYVRFESKYPKIDCMIHDLEQPESGIFNDLGAVYWQFTNGAKYRNFVWIEGNIKWASAKVQKTYEGLTNILTKQKYTELYQIYSPKMPDWYGREVVNVMGGGSLSVFVGQYKTKHNKFEVVDFELSLDAKSCLVLPTGKLRAYEKNIFFGCAADAGQITNQLTAECAAFLSMQLSQFGLGYTSGLRALYFDPNFAVPLVVAFEIRGFKSYDNSPVLTNDITAASATNYTFPLTENITGTTTPKGLLIKTDEQAYQNPADPTDFYVYYDFYITVIRPESCDPSSNGGHITKTVKFTKKVYKLANGNIYAPESESFLNLRIETP